VKKFNAGGQHQVRLTERKRCNNFGGREKRESIRADEGEREHRHLEGELAVKVTRLTHGKKRG